VAASIWLWILPLTFLCYALWVRWQIWRWPTGLNFVLSAVTSAGTVVILIVIGIAAAPLPIKATGPAIILGRGPEICVIFVDRTVMGKLYGHTLREYLDKNPGQVATSTFIVTESAACVLPSRLNKVIVSGRLIQDAADTLNSSRPDRVILINPDGVPEKSEWGNSLASRTWVYFGEYSQTPSRSSWVNFPGIKTLLIDGAADFVPAWPQAVLKSSGA
jgi:hypothetical protein